MNPAVAEEADSEPRYYTWVDAQGVMHNSLITSKKNVDRKSAKIPQEKLDTNTPTNAPDFNLDDFPSEENHQKKMDDRIAEKKPFFTWIDAEGVVRSEAKPDVMVEFVAEEVVYDAVFAPPFRLPKHIKQGQCCERYAAAFTAAVSFNGSASYQVDDTLYPFQTQSGSVSAGYFSLPELADKEIILLKGYKLPRDSSFEVIALDEAFQPLYLASKLKGLFIEQTWKDVAYKKIMLEISDADVKYLVVFVRPQSLSLKQRDVEKNNLKASKLKPSSSQNKIPEKIEALSNYRLSVMRDQFID